MAIVLGWQLAVGSTLVALLLLLDIAVYFLPWRIPRLDRKNLSYGFEQFCYMVPAIGVGLAVLRSGLSWTRPTPISLLLAVLVGVGLMALGGLARSGLLSGDIAFISYDGAPGHALIRGFAVLAFPAAEEAAYRGPLLAVLVGPSYLRWVVAVVCGLAFVGHHYLLAGTEFNLRQLRFQVGAAIALGVLTAWSRSLLPAILAHLIANLPQGLLEGQRYLLGRRN
jgi:membrane protease YdiL (CAAX protease family)